jgi:DNA-binding transcriptional ArsR family regulator
MTTSSQQIEEAALDLAWSLWAELGVSGWQRHHTSHAIDPEPLILFTAFLSEADPRLRDESTDWCIAYGRYISTARLRNLLANESPATRASFGQTAATVNAHSGLRWPAATEERPFKRTGRSVVADFRRPSLIALRLRALFGVGARAEIVRAFVAEPHAVLTAADLAGGAGYTKRNVAEALEALRMAGLVEVERVRNQLAYRLADAEWLLSVPGGMPSLFPRWRSIFRILERTLEATRRAETLRPGVRTVEAADVLRELEPDLRLVGEPPPADEQGQDLWAELERRAIRFSKAWASGATGPA